VMTHDDTGVALWKLQLRIAQEDTLRNGGSVVHT
jgi:hypothetical protein